MKTFLRLALVAGLLSFIATYATTESAFATVGPVPPTVSYVGNGTSSSFTIPFNFQHASDIVAAETSDGGTVIVSPSTYKVSGVGSSFGGTLTLTTGALASGTTLTITRQIPNTQPTSFRAQQNYSPSIHENALDWVEMQVQQLATQIDGGSIVGPAGPPGVIGPTGATGATGSSTPFVILPEADGGTGTGALTCTAGQALTSNGTAYSCTNVGGAFDGGVPWIPAIAPAQGYDAGTISVLNEEFNEAPAYSWPGSGSGWIATPSTGSPLNPLANPSSGNPNIDLGNSRPGWLMIQTAPSGSGGLLKYNSTLTFDTNDVIWARVSSSASDQGGTGYAGLICMELFDSSATHGAGLCFNSNGGSYSAGPTFSSGYAQAFTVASPSTFTQLGGGAVAQSDQVAWLGGYMLILKTGITLTFFCSAGEEGAWTWLGTANSIGWTPAAIAIFFHSQSSSGSVGEIMGIDFVRAYAGNQLP